MDYKTKLQSPKWQKKRLEILERDNFTCKLCGDTETVLHIHHAKYYKGEPWETPNDELFTLCKHCHTQVEKMKAEGYLISKKDFNNNLLYIKKIADWSDDTVIMLVFYYWKKLMYIYENNEFTIGFRFGDESSSHKELIANFFKDKP